MSDWETASALLSVLIADHNHDAVVALTALLIKEGHVVHSVYRGNLVLEAVQRYKPDVCILRLDIPGRSSQAVAEELRRLTPSRRPFLIGAAGGSSRGQEVLARSNGFDHCFAGPVDPVALVAFIREIGTRRRTKKR